MIKTITVTNHLGESMVLELRAPEKSGFLVQTMDGLSPGKATINTNQISGQDGSIYNSGIVAQRNITMSLMFLPSPTIEDTRQKAYRYFPIKKRVGIVIETDNRICETYGYIESNDPNIFSKEETTKISIVCPDAYFYSTEVMNTVFSGVVNNFEFPFFNDSLSANLIEFGTINLQTTQTVYYTGDAEIGIMIYIHFLGTATNITLYNVTTREQMSINTSIFESMLSGPIEAGDEIIISTIKGNKFMYLLRDGEYINILNCLDRNSNWFLLTKGDNLFTYTADTGLTNMQFRIANQILYEGV